MSEYKTLEINEQSPFYEEFLLSTPDDTLDDKQLKQKQAVISNIKRYNERYNVGPPENKGLLKVLSNGDILTEDIKPGFECYEKNDRISTM